VNDGPDPAASDDSPEIAEVRRLLAEARHTEPMPDDVARRMSAAITRLGDETPAARQEPHVVVAMASRRRRRAAGMLVAAAAVVVGGVVATQNVQVTRSGGQAGSAAEDAQQNQNLGNTGNDTNPNHVVPSPRSPNAVRSDDQALENELLDGRFVVHPRHFSTDVREGRRLLQRRADFAASLAPLEADCADPADAARVVPARYRRAPASLVYRRPQDNVQVVDLILCGSSRPLRTTTLPAP